MAGSFPSIRSIYIGDIMIFFGFDFAIPYKNKKDTIDYFYGDWSISKNKAFSIQFSKFGYDFVLIEVEFSYYPYQCHAGPKLIFGMIGYSLILNIYDKRHWDYDKGTWEEYNVL